MDFLIMSINKKRLMGWNLMGWDRIGWDGIELGNSKTIIKFA